MARRQSVLSVENGNNMKSVAFYRKKTQLQS